MLYHYRPPLMSQKNSIFPYCSILIFLSNFNCDRITSPKSSFQFPVSSSSLNFGRNQISPNLYNPQSQISAVASNEKCFNALFSKFNNRTPFINCFDTKGKKFFMPSITITARFQSFLTITNFSFC